MPTWKIKGFKFSFKASEVLEKNKPAHIHVKTAKGEIQYWLDSGEIKTIKGNVTEAEKSKIRDVIKNQKHKFLDAWNKIKERLTRLITESESSSSSEGSDNEYQANVHYNTNTYVRNNDNTNNLAQNASTVAVVASVAVVGVGAVASLATLNPAPLIGSLSIFKVFNGG